MAFRILGVRILEGCAANIRKVLKENTSYLLTSDYTENTSDLILSSVDKKNDSVAQSELYDIHFKNGHTLHVSVSAIVGKNGDGKSTLVEVMISILNNFAVSCGYLKDQKSLQYISGLNAILYYELDSVVYAIKSFDEGLAWYRGGVKIEDISQCQSDLEKKKLLKEKHLKELLYTMVINYSLYGYNSERTPWIENLFHKNDAYQTPVVINPMRTKGNIDVNREDFLSRQRLMTLFTVTDKDMSQKDIEESRKVSETEIAIGYAFSLEEKSKFFKKTIDEYFLKARATTVSWYEAKDFNKYKNLITNECMDMVCAFVERLGSTMADYYALFQYATRANDGWVQNTNTELFHYVSLVQARIANDKRLADVYRTKLRHLRSLKPRDKSKLNYTQMYRLMLIVSIWQIITADDRFNMRHADLNRVISEEQIPRNRAMLYILYKLISIMETYSGMISFSYLSDDKFSCMYHGWIDDNTLGRLAADIDNIYNTHDYRTLKLWQTINYLGREDDIYGADVCTLNGIMEYSHYISFDELRKALPDVGKDITSYLPCPIFVGDIILNNGKENYPLGTLSSGMTQRLNSVGSFVYHLRNLDDEQKADDMISYNNLVAIFEEVELYFHPEYQKSYLRYLLNQIRHSNQSRFENLHIIFVTHSPFILSDVPRTDILCIKDGVPERKVPFLTFAANIHDILRQPFFMENGTIGDYSQYTINRIVAQMKLQEGSSNEDSTQIADEKLDEKYILELIRLIDEPLIRNSLLKEHDRVFKKQVSIDEKIDILKAEIERLETLKQKL